MDTNNKLPPEKPRQTAQYDWWGPWKGLLYTAMVLIKDGLAVASIMVVARLSEWGLEQIGQKAWLIGSYELHASTIVHYGDFILVVGFVVIQAIKLLRRMYRDDH